MQGQSEQKKLHPLLYSKEAQDLEPIFIYIYVWGDTKYLSVETSNMIIFGDLMCKFCSIFLAMFLSIKKILHIHLLFRGTWLSYKKDNYLCDMYVYPWKFACHLIANGPKEDNSRHFKLRIQTIPERRRLVAFEILIFPNSSDWSSALRSEIDG